MEPVMYIFLNKGIKMSKGKVAVQAAHAAVLSYQISKEDAKKKWNENNYTKIMLEALNEKHIEKISEYLQQNYIKTTYVYDIGRTEVKPNTLTALGIEIIDEEHQKEKLKVFKLY